MNVLQQNNIRNIKTMLWRTMNEGLEVKPRGELIREIGDLQLVVHPDYPFMGFKNRKYPFNYFKEEMKWKLTANPYDDSIKAHARMWESVQNPDGTFNSNYGQYWFGEQKGFWTVVEELIRDVHSRRAVIPMLSKDHMAPQTRDTVCTESIGWRIRNDQLVTSVHMRSSDQIFGLGTDIPTFSFLTKLLLGVLKAQYPGLSLGYMTITAMSSHIYERHFDMVDKILNEPYEDFTSMNLPDCNIVEAMSIISNRGAKDNGGGILGRWLFDDGKVIISSET